LQARALLAGMRILLIFQSPNGYPELVDVKSSLF
jgi:hypothetical protein